MADNRIAKALASKFAPPRPASLGPAPLAQLLASAKPKPLDAVYQRYPALQHFAGEIAYSGAPAAQAQGRKLEFYPPGEQNNPTPGKATVQGFGKPPSSQNIAADLVSHYLARGADQQTTADYNKFAASITPQQQKTLHDQYQWARKNEGEARPFGQWSQTTGIPATFRGYAFGQWPAQFNNRYFTPQQKALLSAMVARLQAPDRPH